MNSSQVRRHLRQAIEELKPDRIGVMIGANDPWTAPVPLSDASDDRGLVQRLLEQHSRTHKLWYMVVRAFDPRVVEASDREKTEAGEVGRIRFGSKEFELGYERVSGRSSWESELRENLAAIDSTCRGANIELILMAYPTSFNWYGKANRVIRSAAAAGGSPMIDLQPIFDQRCADEACVELLFWDGHPRVAGHRLIAETMLNELQRRDGPR